MEAIINFLLPIVQNINKYLSDYILFILLIGIGIFYSIRTKFVQIRFFGEGIKRVFGNIFSRNKTKGGGLSSFQALATAVAAQVGTGNIVGACGAILIGGPGAIFWMWLIAFFGMATIYAEATLAQKSRVVQEDGSVLGGPVYYITYAFKGRFGKFLAGAFATVATLALGFMGAMVQSNSIASSVNSASSGAVPNWIVGLILSVICTFIFIGGIRRIASVAEKIVPIMAIIYLGLGIVVLGFNITKIPETFGLIFKYAFVPHALLGGSVGAAIKIAISQGAKRGLFSNESGMGSTPHAHAQATVQKPHDQGVVAMVGVFIDTFVVLTITALVVISTLYTGDGPLSSATLLANNTDITNTNMMQISMGTVFGETAGGILVALCLTFFAFTTIISWNFFGRQNVQYLFGKKSVVFYSIIAVAFIFIGTLFPNSLVWELTDMFNNIMVIPNVIALFALSSVVVGCLKAGVDAKKTSKKK